MRIITFIVLLAASASTALAQTNYPAATWNPGNAPSSLEEKVLREVNAVLGTATDANPLIGVTIGPDIVSLNLSRQAVEDLGRGTPYAVEDRLRSLLYEVSEAIGPAMTNITFDISVEGITLPSYLGYSSAKELATRKLGNIAQAIGSQKIALRAYPKNSPDA
ncbi:MAG: hypothetical protein AAB341_00295 [Planctomycetota bacterium]